MMALHSSVAPLIVFFIVVTLIGAAVEITGVGR